MNRRNLLIGGGAVVVLGSGAALLGTARQGAAADYAKATKAMRAALAARPEAADLIRYATLAPNGHNAQPWRFASAPGQITIHPDYTRRTKVVDPDDHHLFISLGAAAENLSLAGAARGLRGEPVFDAYSGTIGFDYSPGAALESPLFDAIPSRQSTRADYDGRQVSADHLRALAAEAVPGVALVLLTDRARINDVRDLVLSGNTAQMSDPAFVIELKSWLRFNPSAALRTGDGLYSVASGNPALPDWIGPVAFDWLSGAQSQNDVYASQIQSSAGIAVFVGGGETPAHWVDVGRACQRFSLQATSLGMKHAYLNQPVEVAGLRPELAAIVGMPGRRPDPVMRFGYGAAMPYAPRRPVASVMRA